MIRSLNRGANDYIAKPFRLGVLRARVRAQLRQSRLSDEAIFPIGPHSFHPSAKMLIETETERKILYRTTTKNVPKAFGKALYRGRARIEQAIGKLKRFKRIALRCQKTKQNFASFVAIAAAFISVKSVLTD